MSKAYSSYLKTNYMKVVYKYYYISQILETLRSEQKLS